MTVFNPLFPTPKNVFAPINLLLTVSNELYHVLPTGAFIRTLKVSDVNTNVRLT